MIENMMYFEQLLHNIQYELWQIGQLDPSNFVSKLQQCPPGGWEEQVLNMLRQAVHEYHTERAILKYLYIGDKLAKLPGFQTVVPPFLVDLYCDVFYFLYLQKCNKELQEVKILRKFWVGSVHPFFLSKMRENVMTRTGVDIDVFSKVQTIAKIKAHYANKLGMSEEEINKHFPQPKRPSEEKRFDRKSEERFSQSYSNGQTNYQPYSYQPTNRDTLNLVATNYQPNPYQHYSNPQISASYSANRSPQSFPNGYNIPPSQPTPFDLQLPLPANDPRLQGEIKRKRFASEETRAVGVPSEWEPKPKKNQHKEEVVLDCHLMLERLKQMNQYECRQCGLKFSSGNNLETHKDQHIRQKLSAIEDEKREKQWEISSVESWVGEGLGELQCEQFVIGEQVWSEEEAWCSFCCCWLGRSWVNDHWVLSNASLVQLGGELAIMHKSCQRTLQNAQKKRPS